MRWLLVFLCSPVWCQWLVDRLEEASGEAADVILEAVIMAETEGKNDEAHRKLIEYLVHHRDMEAGNRALFARAIAHLSNPSAGDWPSTNEVAGQGRLGGYSFVFVAGQWLGLGDWYQGHYLLRVDGQSATFRHANESVRIVPFAENLGALTGDGLQGDIDAVIPALRFCARRAGLNLLTPGFSGGQPIAARAGSWIELIDSICRQNNWVWTKLQQSVVLDLANPYAGDRLSLDMRGQRDLGSFLQHVAQAMNLDLYLDDTISHLVVDVSAETMDWQEALDCIAIMNDLEWSITTNTPRSRLIVTTR